MQLIETSAKTGENIDEAFMTMAAQLKASVQKTKLRAAEPGESQPKRVQLVGQNHDNHDYFSCMKC
jgi:translation initiation factor IF-2